MIGCPRRTDVGDTTLLGSGEVGIEATVGVHCIGDAQAGDGQGQVGQHVGRDSQRWSSVSTRLVAAEKMDLLLQWWCCSEEAWIAPRLQQWTSF